MTAGGRSAKAIIGRKQLFALIAIMAVGVAVVAGLSARNAIWEGWLIDRLYQVKAHLGSASEPARSPVAVIGLDQTALDSKRLAALPRVFMTPVLAEAGQALLDAGALALGYDFVFAYSADAFVHPGTGEAPLLEYDTPFKRFIFQNRGKVFIAHADVGVPHRSFAGAAGSGGVRSVIISPDSDGVVRRHTPTVPLNDSAHLIDVMLEKAGAGMSESYLPVPKSRLATAVPYLSLIDALKLLESEEGRAELERFAQGRIVLFGGVMAIEDHHYYSDRFLPRLASDLAETGESGRPEFLSKYTAGVLILADFVAAAVSGRAVVAPPGGVLPAIAILFAVMGAAAGLFLPLVTLPLAAIFSVGLGLGLSLIGLEFGVLLAPGAAAVAGVTAMVIAAVGKIGILQRRQRALVRLFGHYLAPGVIKQMAHSEQLPELGGHTRPVVVAFIDIVGFTKMSEKLADKDVVRVVNSCFDAIGEVITAHNGYIDKYIGDAIMAVWNAPNTVDNPEQAAVDAARDIIGLLDNIRKKTGQDTLDLRIALNAGPVLVGDIGGEHRRSFTVMGTTVNTASRIESVAKEKKVRLAVSQSVADELPDNYPVIEIWTGQLRGLSSDLSVFTLDQAEVYMEPEASSQDLNRPRLVKVP